MPKSSSSTKHERQYREISDGATKRGRGEPRAEELATRKVNKLRREDGRTETEQEAHAASASRPLEARTKDELIDRARALYISGRKRMTKAELVRAIQEKR